MKNSIGCTLSIYSVQLNIHRDRENFQLVLGQVCAIRSDDIHIEYILVTRTEDGKRIGDLMAETRVIDLKPKKPGWIFAILAFVLIFAVIFYQAFFLFSKA